MFQNEKSNLLGGLCFLVVILVVIIYFVKKFSNWDKKVNIKLLSLKYYPVIGHLPALISLDRSKHLDFFAEEIKTTEKKMIKFYLPMSRTLVFNANPENVKHINSTQHRKGYYQKGEISREMFHPFVGDGIFNVVGEEWKEERKFAKPLFKKSYLREYAKLFDSNSKRLLDIWDEMRMTEEGIKEGIDVQTHFMNYTMDSFCEIGFGINLNTIEANAMNETDKFSFSFDYLQQKSISRDQLGKFLKVFELFNKDHMYYECVDYIDDFIYAIIDERIKEDVDILVQRSDLLSKLLIKSIDSQSNTIVVDETQRKKLRDFIINYLIAGRDTTAILLTFVTYCLSKHPEVEERVVNEINKLFGDKVEFDHDLFTLENLSKLPYLDAVIKETLRLFPPVPVDGYTCVKDDVLPDGTFISKGTQVMYSPYIIHRREDLFKNADQFFPDRWTKEYIKKTNIEPPNHPFAFNSFHRGPRQCLGKDLALVEAKIMLISALKRFRFVQHDNHTIKLKFSLILSSENGVKMTIIPRNQ
eukprot:TRINITY_DN7517_c0_g1_i1.p1 TRINITY_DN7517_c0_g1~~TRINITY_DN7517_c0_g1_i1.p1  ORF type:complete len:528 (-),score=124.49 TRINITY_DN7517_c0_g1_i1:79-1662(-)